MHTEKRRVYDIMNIFEGFGAVSRKAKNMYSWKGLPQISVALDIIQQRCVDLLQSKGLLDTNNRSEDSALSILRDYNFERTKSLGLLCESFICLFLVWKPIITLEEAATKIPKILNNESKLKTKVRRLYDIANVLCVLKVIKKTLLSTGKPAFEWVGKSGIEDFCIEMDEESNESEASNSVSISDPQTPITSPPKIAENAQFVNFDYMAVGCPNNTPVPIEHIISKLPFGLNENSLDLLEGIVKVLRRRLREATTQNSTL